MRLTQSFTPLGWLGAVMAVGAPLALLGLASWSFNGMVDVLTSRYTSDTIDDYLIHPALYVLLIAAGSIGWVLVIIGRVFESTTIVSSTSSQPPQPLGQASEAGHEYDRRLSGFKSRIKD